MASTRTVESSSSGPGKKRATACWIERAVAAADAPCAAVTAFSMPATPSLSLEGGGAGRRSRHCGGSRALPARARPVGAASAVARAGTEREPVLLIECLEPAGHGTEQRRLRGRRTPS